MATPSPSQNKSSKKIRRKSASPGAPKQGHQQWLSLALGPSSGGVSACKVPSNRIAAFQQLEHLPEPLFLPSGEGEGGDFGSLPSGVLVSCGETTKLIGRWTTLDKLTISEYLHVTPSSVLMHPETMRSCGCVFSSSVVIRGRGSKSGRGSDEGDWPYVCGKVLPLPSLPLDMVGLGSCIRLGCEALDGEFVEVWPLALPSSQFQIARKITLFPSRKADDYMYMDSGFKKRLLHMCGWCLVTPFSHFSIQYLGAEKSFKIVEVLPLLDKSQQNGVKNLSRELEEDLSNLSLNESSDFSSNNHSSAVDLDIFRITSRTEFKIATDTESEGVSNQPHSPRLSDVGGLEKQIQLLSDLVLHPLQAQPMIPDAVYPLGVILHGPPGVGKSLVARALMRESPSHSICLSAAQLLAEDATTVLQKTFLEARRECPCLVIIDDLDTLCPHHDGHGDTVTGDVERKATACLLTQLDELRQCPPSRHVTVLATTNQIDRVAPQLRQPGRFAKEVELTVPSSRERLKILEQILRGISHSLTHEDIKSLAEKAHGYVGADLLAVCSEAQYKALQRVLESRRKAGSKEELGDNNVTATSAMKATCDDMLSALREVGPSAMREVSLEVPKVLWSEIGGQEEVKMCLREAVERPITHPEVYAKMGTRPPKGVLLYGPPGCSKTMVARALATESGLNFLSVKGPELFSKWVGDSERAVRQIFSRARAAAPAIIFFDEIDALAVERKNEGSSVADRVLTQLLTELDGVERLGDVLVVAATNRPDMIDKALLRPGRIDELIYVPLPSDATRRDIFKIQFSKIPVDQAEVELEQLVAETKGFSGAEVVSLCQKASLYALRAYFEGGCSADLSGCCVKRSHFEAALRMIFPQTSPQTLKYYEDFKKRQKNVFNSPLM